MITNPKEYWQSVSEKPDWKAHILPGRSDADFDAEGLIEAQRLFYFFDDKSTVVDYGCGVGRVLQYVAESAHFVIGLDVCEGFLDRAVKSIKRDNVAFFQVDEYFEKSAVDFVYCLMVMQHNDATSRAQIMEHICWILKKGGAAVISFPQYESTYYEETDTLHKFTKEEVEAYGKIFQSFRIIEGNLPGYEKPCTGNNEYFLIAVK